MSENTNNVDGYKALLEAKLKGYSLELLALDQEFQAISSTSVAQTSEFGKLSNQIDDIDDLVKNNRELLTEIRKTLAKWSMLQNDLIFMGVKIGTLLELMPDFEEGDPNLIGFAKQCARAKGNMQYLVLDGKVQFDPEKEAEQVLNNIEKDKEDHEVLKQHFQPYYEKARMIKS